MKKMKNKKNYNFFLIKLFLMQSALLYPSVIDVPMFSVVSWNILGPNTQDAAYFVQVGDYSRIFKIINRILMQMNGTYGPSIVCLQEVDAKSLKILDSKLFKQYDQVSYQPKGKNGGVVLFAKKSKFDVLDGQGVELSEGGAAAVGLLRSKKTGKILAVSSLHVSRRNDVSDQKKGELQLKKLQEAVVGMIKHNKLNPKNVLNLYAGDFNTNADEIMNNVLNFLEKNDGHTYFDAFGCEDTVNDKEGNRKGIDHIITSGALKKVNHHSKIFGNKKNKKIHDQVESDHAVLYAVYKEGN